MPDKPIIFSAPMVRALLDGKKTQTRRVLKPQPSSCGGRLPGAIYSNDFYWPISEGVGLVSCKPHPPEAYLDAHPLRYAPGDRLYVRENWQALSHGDYQPTKAAPPYCDIRYAATDPLADLPSDTRGYPWRPSIHMPRWASRITLTVTDVRVQRLQDCSEADAMAEGVRFERNSPDDGHRHWIDLGGGDLITGWDAREVYALLWGHLHGGGAWHENPWVAAYSFTVQRGNIDQIGGAA